MPEITPHPPAPAKGRQTRRAGVAALAALALVGSVAASEAEAEAAHPNALAAVDTGGDRVSVLRGEPDLGSTLGMFPPPPVRDL